MSINNFALYAGKKATTTWTVWVTVKKLYLEDKVVLSYKPGWIRVGRIKTFPFLPIPFTTPSLRIQWKLSSWSRKQKRKNQPIATPGIELCHWFIFPLLLATPTMQFSLDRKRGSYKQNQCSASNSVGLIFSRSYRSTLLIATPTTTPWPVITSL